jgi:muramoyltetrapeptide carboxypeptidase
MRGLIGPDTVIAAVAPSGAFQQERFAAGLEIARSAGFDVRVPPVLQRPLRYLAGDDEHRLHQLVHALTDPAYGAVWAVRGGYGVTRLLDRLPWSTLPPRPVIGFSDLTPLLEALRVRVGSNTVHGPMLHSLPDTSEPTRAASFAVLRGEPVPALRGTVIRGGFARGPLVGGNLAMLTATLGTAFAPQVEGAILCLEDVGEPVYRIDRMLQHLRMAGVLDAVAGVALGSFTACRPPQEASWTLHEVLVEHLAPLGKPVLADLPFGHGAENHALPIGRVATLHDDALAWEAQH